MKALARAVLVLTMCSSLAPLACRGKPTPLRADDSPGASVTENRTSDAGGGASAPADTGAPSALSDLLHATRASVAVSSNVANPRDYPDHLLDGHEETAWNGRTGDLTTGFIKLQVPDDATVDHVEMSVGFDKIGKDGDLFTMNHRIKRVRVLRDGKVLVANHAFDIDVRTPQSIPIHAAGGTFKIEVLETVAGTKKTWRELCVSELRVMGTPGPSARGLAPAAPVVTVGFLPHEYEKMIADAESATAKLLGRVFPSVDAFCKAWDKTIGPSLDARRAAGEEIVPKDHACVVGQALSASFTPSTEVKAVTKVTVFAVNWTEDRIAVETPAGVVVPSVKPLDTQPFNDPGCFGSNAVTIDSVKATGNALEVAYTDSWTNGRTFYDADGGVTGTTSSDDVKKIDVACSAAGGSGLRCTRTITSQLCHVDGPVVPCDSF
jgi:hypothetical protein